MAPAPKSAELAALGGAIRRLREEQDLSQEQLGLEIGVSRTHIGHIERAEKSPTFDVLVRIASGLGVRLTQLMQSYEGVLHNALESPASD